MRLLVHALLLSATAMAPAYAQGGFTPAPRLQVNTDDQLRYVVRMPLKEGLAALEEVVFSHEHEEVWVYDPDAHEWLEVGQGTSGWHQQTLDTLTEGVPLARNTARVDHDLFARLRARAGALIHTHNVRNAPDYLYARSQEDYRVSAARIAFVKITNAIPSLGDLYAMLYDLAGTPNDDREFPFYIGSFGGVTRFTLTPDGREHARQLLADATTTDLEQETPRIASADAFVATIRERLVAAVNAAVDDRGTQSYNTILQEVCERASDSRFRIEYATYRDLDRLFPPETTRVDNTPEEAAHVYPPS